jgi:hypothetical protein
VPQPIVRLSHRLYPKRVSTTPLRSQLDICRNKKQTTLRRTWREHKRRIETQIQTILATTKTIMSVNNRFAFSATPLDTTAKRKTRATQTQKKKKKKKTTEHKQQTDESASELDKRRLRLVNAHGVANDPELFSA